MFAPNNWRDHALNVAPYLILMAFLPLNMAISSMSSMDTDTIWTLLRWVIRVTFITGAALGWVGTTWESRPHWVYTWLGFAIYEGVSLLIIAFMGAMSLGQSSLILLSFVLIFTPYYIGSVWVARRDRQLAAFTVFPHAALTLPLFIFSISEGNEWPDDMLIPALIVSLCAGLITLLIPMLERRRRWTALYMGMAVTQFALTVSFVVVLGDFFILVVTIPLIILGTVILTGPLILLPIAKSVYVWIPRNGIRPLLDLIGQSNTLWQQTGIYNRIKNFDGGQSMTEKFEPKLPPSEQSVEPNVEETAQQVTPPPMPPGPPSQPNTPTANPNVDRRLNRLYRLSVVILTIVIVLSGIVFVSRSAVYKIHEYERGLHLRGGRFVGEQLPGWHIQIPLVDTVIIVKVNERLGYVQRIPAMASDNVTMIVSLQYTYRVTQPSRFALEVDDPERIVFEFVQGKLRDVVNTKEMSDVMNDRAQMNQEVMDALKEKEEQYGVKFITVQMQSASPPDEVLTAIKDRMVAIQQQEQAQAEAAQQKTLADAQLYTAQTQADAEAYQITTTAQAEANSIKVKTEAQQLVIRAILEELESKGQLGEKFIPYLIAQELKENSKLIIGGEGTPILDLRSE